MSIWWASNYRAESVLPYIDNVKDPANVVNDTPCGHDVTYGSQHKYGSVSRPLKYILFGVGIATGIILFKLLKDKKRKHAKKKLLGWCADSDSKWSIYEKMRDSIPKGLDRVVLDHFYINGGWLSREDVMDNIMNASRIDVNNAITDLYASGKLIGNTMFGADKFKINLPGIGPDDESRPEDTIDVSTVKWRADSDSKWSIYEKMRDSIPNDLQKKVLDHFFVNGDWLSRENVMDSILNTSRIDVNNAISELYAFGKLLGNTMFGADKFKINLPGIGPDDESRPEDTIDVSTVKWRSDSPSQAPSTQGPLTWRSGAVDILTPENADAVVDRLNSEINAPIVQVTKSTLGGPDKPHIIMVISLDTKESWPNNIFENSRYIKFSFEPPNVLELFQKHYKIKKKFRKSRVKNVDDLINRINKYIAEVQPVDKPENKIDVSETRWRADDNTLADDVMNYLKDESGSWHTIDTIYSKMVLKRSSFQKLERSDISGTTSYLWLRGKLARRQISRVRKTWYEYRYQPTFELAENVVVHNDENEKDERLRKWGVGDIGKVIKVINGDVTRYKINFYDNSDITNVYSYNLRAPKESDVNPTTPENIDVSTVSWRADDLSDFARDKAGIERIIDSLRPGDLIEIKGVNLKFVVRFIKYTPSDDNRIYGMFSQFDRPGALNYEKAVEKVTMRYKNKGKDPVMGAFNMDDAESLRVIKRGMPTDLNIDVSEVSWRSPKLGNDRHLTERSDGKGQDVSEVSWRSDDKRPKASASANRWLDEQRRYDGVVQTRREYIASIKPPIKDWRWCRGHSCWPKEGKDPVDMKRQGNHREYIMYYDGSYILKVPKNVYDYYTDIPEMNDKEFAESETNITTTPENIDVSETQWRSDDKKPGDTVRHWCKLLDYDRYSLLRDIGVDHEDAEWLSGMDWSELKGHLTGLQLNELNDSTQALWNIHSKNEPTHKYSGPEDIPEDRKWVAHMLKEQGGSIKEMRKDFIEMFPNSPDVDKFFPLDTDNNKKPCKIDIFRGINMGDPHTVLNPKEAKERTKKNENKDVSDWVNMRNWVTFNPMVATMFAIMPKNELLNDPTMENWIRRAQKSGIYEGGPDTSWFEHELDRWVKYQLDKMYDNDWGFIFRGEMGDNIKHKIEIMNQHLMEMEIFLNEDIPITHIGVVDKETFPAKWLHIKNIPKKMFKRSGDVRDYIKDKGKKKKWNQDFIPTAFMWALEEGMGYYDDDPDSIVADLRQDITLRGIFCNKVPKYEKYKKKKGFVNNKQFKRLVEFESPRDAVPRKHKLMTNEMKKHKYASLPGVASRRHKLMTNELKKRFAKIKKIFSDPLRDDNKKFIREEPVIVAKYFNPYGDWKYFVMWYDGDDQMFGVEVGAGLVARFQYESLQNIEERYTEMGNSKLPWERDKFWSEITLSSLINDLSQDYDVSALSDVVKPPSSSVTPENIDVSTVSWRTN